METTAKILIIAVACLCIMFAICEVQELYTGGTEAITPEQAKVNAVRTALLDPACPRITLEVRAGRGADDIADRAGYYHKYPRIQSPVLWDVIEGINGPDESWREGDIVYVPVPSQ